MISGVTDRYFAMIMYIYVCVCSSMYVFATSWSKYCPFKGKAENKAI